jgi:hypothetical protein
MLRAVHATPFGADSGLGLSLHLLDVEVFDLAH